MAEQLTVEEKLHLDLIMLRESGRHLLESATRLLAICRYEMGYQDWLEIHPVLDSVLPDRVKRRLYARKIRKSIEKYTMAQLDTVKERE